MHNITGLPVFLWIASHNMNLIDHTCQLPWSVCLSFLFVFLTQRTQLALSSSEFVNFCHISHHKHVLTYACLYFLRVRACGWVCLCVCVCVCVWMSGDSVLTDCQVTISTVNWTVSGSCHVEQNVSNYNYSCEWEVDNEVTGYSILVVLLAKIFQNIYNKTDDAWMIYLFYFLF